MSFTVPSGMDSGSVRRTIDTRLPENAAQVSPTFFIDHRAIAIDSPVPTGTQKSLIPHWSYEKSSLAAASIFSAVALFALVFLSAVYVRRLKKRWDQHMREKQTGEKELTTAAYSIASLSDTVLAVQPSPPGGAGRLLERESLMADRDFTSSLTLMANEPHACHVYGNNTYDVSAMANDWKEHSATSQSVSQSDIDGTAGISPVQAHSAQLGSVQAKLTGQGHGYVSSGWPIQRESPAKLAIVRPAASLAVPMSARPSGAIKEQATLSFSHTKISRDPTSSRPGETYRASDPELLGRTKHVKLSRIERSQSPVFRFATA